MCRYSDKFIEEVKNDPTGVAPKKLAQMIVDKALSETVLDSIKNENEHFVQEVIKIVSSLRLKYGEEEAWESCATISDYRSFKENYPNSIHITEADEKIADFLIKEEEEAWESCATISDYRSFKENYPDSIHITEADEKIADILIKEEEDDWNKTCKTGTKEAYQAFIKFYSESQSEHVKDANKALEELERIEKEREQKAKEEENRKNEEKVWNNCTFCQDFVEFKKSYPASLHINECEEKAWSACLACNRKEDYQLFKEAFPVSRHYVDAEERLINLNDPDALHTWLCLKSDSKVNVNKIMDFYDGHEPFKKQIHDYFVEDMPFNPNRYSRDAMFRILRSNIFEPGELVRRRILTETAKNWIELHPRDIDDEHVTDIPVDTSPVSPAKNTDVYFFGVSGSGKSTVLAGLFKLESENMKGLNIKLLTTTKGYNYAKDLTQYVKEGLFPLPTKTETTRKTEGGGTNEEDSTTSDVDEGDSSYAIETQNVTDKYIQIMNTELTETVKDKDYTHHITFIEMPGERTLQFAAGGAGGDLKSLGAGTEKLFRNGNRKIIFFILDPDPKKGQFVKVNQADVFITQGETLNLIVELIAKEPDILDTIDAIHIILTKSDILPCYCSDMDANASMDDLIEKVMDQEGYAAFKRELIKLCSPKNSSINKHCGHRPYVFTFSLGKVMPGHVVDYRRTSSEIILNVIRANTRSVKENSGFDSFKEGMNKVPFKK